MEKQLTLFDTINEATNPACFLGAVTARFCFLLKKIRNILKIITKMFGK